MKRITVVVALVLAALVLVTGCSKKEAAESSGKVTLRVLNYADAAEAGYAIEKKIWDDFRAANPDIILEYEELFDEPFHHKTEAYAASGNLPDVLFMWPSGRSSTLYNKGLVKDLTPLVAPIKNNLEPYATAPQAHGILGEIPQTNTNTSYMFVNDGLLKQLGLEKPKTYQDMVNMVPVARAAGVEVLIMPAMDDWVFQSCLFSLVSGRLAGDEFIDAALAGNAKFTDQKFVDVLDFFAKLVKDGVMNKNVLNIDYGQGPNLFASGKCLFYIDGDWRVGAFITDPETGEALIPVNEQPNYSIMNFPAIPGEINKNSSSVIVGTGYGMNANIPAGSAKEAAAWRLIQYLVSPEVAKQKLESGAFLTASWIGVTSDKLEPLSRAAAKVEVDIPTYVIDGVLDAQVFGPINVGLQEIVLGTKTPAQVAADTQKALEAWRAAQ